MEITLGDLPSRSLHVSATFHGEQRPWTRHRYYDWRTNTYATPDEFAWLDVGYTALKLIGFMTAPWLMSRFHPRHVIIGATLVMGLACAIAASTALRRTRQKSRQRRPAHHCHLPQRQPFA